MLKVNGVNGCRCALVIVLLIQYISAATQTEQEIGEYLIDLK